VLKYLLAISILLSNAAQAAEVSFDGLWEGSAIPRWSNPGHPQQGGLYRYVIKGSEVHSYRQLDGKFVEAAEKYRILYLDDAAFISLVHVDDALVIQGELLKHKSVDVLTMRHATPRDDGTPVINDKYIPQPDWVRVR
jgi:hypothetical protein